MKDPISVPAKLNRRAFLERAAALGMASVAYAPAVAWICR